MLTDKDAVISAVELINSDDFYREDHKAIYEAITSLYNRAEPIDIITVKSELTSRGKLESVGGIEYLAALPEKVPTTANEIINLGYAGEEEVDSIMEMTEKKVFDILKKRNQRGYTPIKDVLVETFAEIERLYNQKGIVTGIPTGFLELDYKTAGLHNSDLILVAARPAMGKSAFVINIAANAAIKAKVPVVIFNLEMSKEQVANRILCSEAMVDSQKVRTGKIEETDWEKLATALGPISEAPIYIDDTPRNFYY